MFSGLRSTLFKFFENNDFSAKRENLNLLISKLRNDLIDNDVSVSFADFIFKSLIWEVNNCDKNISESELKTTIFNIMYKKTESLLGSSFEDIKLFNDKMNVIMICGPQGAGKTSFCVKLANRIKLKKQHMRIAVCSTDKKRSAAQTQLKILSENACIDYIDVYGGSYEFSTPVSCAAYLHSIAYKAGYSLLIIDTHGTSIGNQVDMKRLVGIKEVIKPNETFLVLDSIMGQISTIITKSFDDIINISGIVLTKMDSDEHIGVAINVKSITNKPIKYLTTGERISNIEEFHPSRIIKRLFNVVDKDGITDYVQNNFESFSRDSLAKRIANGIFDLNDLFDQLVQINNNNGISAVFRYLPIIKNEEKERKNKLIQKQIAIISSMTKAEKENPNIIDESRRKRISAGSGSSVSDVVAVIQRWARIKGALV